MEHFVGYYIIYFVYLILMNNLNELIHFRLHMYHHRLNFQDMFRFYCYTINGYFDMFHLILMFDLYLNMKF